MTPDQRSNNLVNQVLAILEAAEACEDGIRQGADEVRLGDRVLPRGEAGLAEIDKFRDSMAAPAIAAIALNLDRIATVLEDAEASASVRRADSADYLAQHLARYTDQELIAELADRAARRVTESG